MYLLTIDIILCNHCELRLSNDQGDYNNITFSCIALSILSYLFKVYTSADTKTISAGIVLRNRLECAILITDIISKTNNFHNVLL